MGGRIEGEEEEEEVEEDEGEEEEEEDTNIRRPQSAVSRRAREVTRFPFE